MKCTSCDTELAPGARECQACGAPIEDSNVSAVVSENPPEMVEAKALIDTSQPPSPYDAFTLTPAQPGSSPYQDSVPSFSTPGEGAANGSTAPASVIAEGEKIFGIPAESIGNVALGLGGAGCLFSVIGCGGIISVLGLIAGFMALKTSGRRNGTIGLVLSGLGIIVTLIMLCVVLFLFLQANPR